jgi:hypothetical protein
VGFSLDDLAAKPLLMLYAGGETSFRSLFVSRNDHRPCEKTGRGFGVGLEVFEQILPCLRDLPKRDRPLKK